MSIGTFGPKQAVAIALLAAGAIAVAPTLLDAGGPSDGCESGSTTTVVTSAEETHAPRVWASWIVWHEQVSTSDSPFNPDRNVYAYHIPRGEVRDLATGPDMQTGPVIYRSTVVWREVPSDGSPIRLMVHDLQKGTTKELSLPINISSSPLGIHGETILVLGHEGNESANGLYAYDLAEGSLQQLTDYDPGSAGIWEDTVVWPVHAQRDGETSHIISHDLSSGESEVIYESAAGLDRPHIQGGTMVFMQSSDAMGPGDWDVYGLNIPAGGVYPVATNGSTSAIQHRPHVTGDWVVFMNYTRRADAPSTLTSVHIPTGVSYDLVSGQLGAYVDVWGDRAVTVQVDVRSGNAEIVLACLPDP